MGMGIKPMVRQKTHEQQSFIKELLKVALISFIIIFSIRYFLFKPFYVKGASMEPTFFEHEYLIIDELTYRFQEPKRGDVVVFRPPNQSREYYIKRIVGLPGETLKFVEGEVIIFNEENPKGLKLDESMYLQTDEKPQETVVLKLSTDEFFVLGDNRLVSSDSRRFGPIKRGAIVGRTWLRGWPIDRVGLIYKTPVYEVK